MTNLATSRLKQRTAVLVSKVGCLLSLLYCVEGETEIGEEKAFILKNNESEAAQYARTRLGFEIVTSVRLVNDCIWA